MFEAECRHDNSVTPAKLAGTAVALAAVVAGCASQPAATSGSAQACYQFAARAIQQHVTVATTPAACQGLSPDEMNVAVSRALRAAAAGVRGLPERREVIGRDIGYVAGLERTVPSQSTPGQAGAPQPSRPPSRAALSLAALVAWLITAGLGLSMMARWITRIRRPARWPLPNFAHSGLALTGLLVWISYLAAGVTALAWVACGLLLAVVSLGMILVFPLADGPGDDPPPAARPPAPVIAAHIIAACAAVLLAVLAASA